MNKRFMVLSVAALNVLFGPACRADLSNRTYQDGKAAYRSEDFGNAARLLQAYLSDDRKYLDTNPSIRNEIAAAIDYCIHFQKTHFHAAGSGIDDKAEPAPALP
jgi:hypothetical protein